MSNRTPPPPSTLPFPAWGVPLTTHTLQYMHRCRIRLVFLGRSSLSTSCLLYFFPPGSGDWDHLAFVLRRPSASCSRKTITFVRGCKNTNEARFQKLIPITAYLPIFIYFLITILPGLPIFVSRRFNYVWVQNI